MTLPYKAISWAGNEPVATDKLNTMANNEQWLFENMGRMQYDGYSLKKFAGIKVLAGYALIPASTAPNGWKPVYFGQFFSTGCQPIVVAQAVSTNGQNAYIPVVNGIGRNIPDHTGVNLGVITRELNPKSNKISASVYIHFIAVGF